MTNKIEKIVSLCTRSHTRNIVLRLVAVLPMALLIRPHSEDQPAYQWVQATREASGRNEDRWVAGTWPNIHAQPVELNDSLLIVGRQHTWKSPDGIHWAMYSHDGGWGTRYGAAFTVYRGRIWMMGGMERWEKFAGDIWSSEDGLHWTLEVPSAPWAARRGHAVMVHDGRLWLVGGAESSGQPNVLPKESVGDVWVSDDGRTWTCVTKSAPWKSEFSLSFFSTTMSAHAMEGKMWVLGGRFGNGVWSSGDGLHWNLVAKSAAWLPRYARGSAVFDHAIWVFGGPGLNDVWHSKDGLSWMESEKAPWSPRAPGNTVVFQNRLWLFGGKTGKSGRGQLGDDVWFLQKDRTKAP